MNSLENEHLAEMEEARQRRDREAGGDGEGKKTLLDRVAAAYGFNTRAERRAFKSNLKRRARQEARKQRR